MIEVYLTDIEIQEALNFVAAMRSDKKGHNVTDKKFDLNNTSWAVNLMGHLGEKVVAKTYRIPVDNRILSGGDGGIDLRISDKTVQVKTSATNQLIFNSKNLFTADYAIFVTLVGERTQPHINSKFRIWGDITKEKFLDVCYEKDYGYGLRYVCNINNLGWELKPNGTHTH